MEFHPPGAIYLKVYPPSLKEGTHAAWIFDQIYKIILCWTVPMYFWSPKVRINLFNEWIIYYKSSSNNIVADFFYFFY